MTTDTGSVSGLVICGPGVKPEPARLEWHAGRITRLVPVELCKLQNPDACTPRQPRPATGTAPNLPVIAPGFIDSHTHPVELGLEGIFPDLHQARTVPELLEQLRAGLNTGREAGVLFGLNLDPDRLAETRMPTRPELDALAPDLPVIACRVDRHSAALNRAALSKAGLDPTGDGLISGPDYEQAARVFGRTLPARTIAAALDYAATLAARAGVTTIAALDGTDEYRLEDWQTLVRLLERLPVRAVPFLQTLNPDTAARLGLPRVGGCILVDGSLGSHTAALKTGYADAPDERGQLYLRDEDLACFLRRADELGLQTALHAIGDRAVEQALRCHALARTRPGLRHRLEHAVLLDRTLIAEIARLGMFLGVQPAFEAAWGGPDRLYARRLGPRHRQTNPFRSLLAAGVRLAGGSDAPITPINPLAGIRAALEHQNPEERIEPDQALAMFTTEAAASLGLETETGRLAPGLCADFTRLDADPRQQPDCRVLETWCRGRRIYPA